jgi:hypothetical protein
LASPLCTGARGCRFVRRCLLPWTLIARSLLRLTCCTAVTQTTDLLLNLLLTFNNLIKLMTFLNLATQGVNIAWLSASCCWS